MESSLHYETGVSVIIPTLNAAKTIHALIDALNKQTCKPREIIIVDSASNDHTATIAENAGARVFSISRLDFNHGLTRNFGAQKATGQILVFMTQDAIPKNSKTLEMLIKPIVNGTSAAAYARQIPYSNANPIEQFWRNYNYPAISMLKDVAQKHRKYFFSNVCSAFYKSIFDQLEGFDSVEICEDVLMSYKLLNAGYRVAYQAEAVVYHSHNDSLRTKSRRYYLIGRFNRMHSCITCGSSNEKDGMVTVISLLRNLILSCNFCYAGMAFVDMLCRYTAYKAGCMSVSLHPSIASDYEKSP